MGGENAGLVILIGFHEEEVGKRDKRLYQMKRKGNSWQRRVRLSVVGNKP